MGSAGRLQLHDCVARSEPSFRVGDFRIALLQPGSCSVSLPHPRSTVVFRDVQEGAVLFCTATEIYFALNHMGARIWRLLPPECASEEEVVARLSELHPEVNLGTIAADLRRLLDELAANGLVESTKVA